jgi:plasmid stability protein
MPDLWVRGLALKTIRRLKARGAASGRTVQQEAKAILENSVAEKTLDEVRDEAKESGRRFEDRHFTDSVELVREDRDR